MDKCPNFGRWFFGCKFKPRHDYIPPEKIGPLNTSVGGAVDFIHACTRQVYVCDICVRCGKTVNRPPESGRKA